MAGMSTSMFSPQLLRDYLQQQTRWFIEQACYHRQLKLPRVLKNHHLCVTQKSFHVVTLYAYASVTALLLKTKALSNCSSSCDYQGYRTAILRLLVQVIDRRCLEAIHLGFQSGIPDDVALLSYLSLQEFIIPIMYRENRQHVAHWATLGCSYASGVLCGSSLSGGDSPGLSERDTWWLGTAFLSVPSKFIIPIMYRENRQHVAHWATLGCSYASGVLCGSGSVLPRFGRWPPRWKLWLTFHDMRHQQAAKTWKRRT